MVLSYILLKVQDFHVNKMLIAINRSTQRAVLINSCSTEGILLGKSIQVYVLFAGKTKYICWETFLKSFLRNRPDRREVGKILFELWTMFEIC